MKNPYEEPKRMKPAHDDDKTNIELAKAKSTVFRLFRFRPRSEQEIVAKLKGKHVSAETITKILVHFRKLDYIDDRRFAKMWTTSRLLRAGVNRIRMELRQKGIADDIIQETIGSIPEDYSELETTLTVARKQIRKYAKLDPLKQKRRLFEYLVRRGFRQSTAQKALRQLLRTNYDHE